MITEDVIHEIEIDKDDMNLFIKRDFIISNIVLESHDEIGNRYCESLANEKEEKLFQGVTFQSFLQMVPAGAWWFRLMDHYTPHMNHRILLKLKDGRCFAIATYDERTLFDEYYGKISDESLVTLLTL